jgi:hypothetical protein
MTRDSSNHEPSRRDFVKKATYVAPAILSLAVAPSYVKAASDKPKPTITPKPPKPPKPK